MTGEGLFPENRIVSLRSILGLKEKTDQELDNTPHHYLPRLATLQEPTGKSVLIQWREPSECTRRIYVSQRLYPPLPPAAGGTAAGGAADRDRNRPTDRKPTAALPTNRLHIPARVADLDATANDGGD